MSGRLLSAALAAVLCAALGVRPGSVVATAQILVNGGFEAGTSGWAGSGLSASGCPARSGASALNLAPAGGLPAIASQQIQTAFLGSYSLSGFARLGSGGPVTLEASLVWLDAQGSALKDDRASLALSTSYQAFAVSSVNGPPDAVTLVIRLRAQGSGSACIDDVALEGPPAATATPSPTLTPTPAPTDTPTRTPTAPPATPTPRPPTATRVPSSTRAPTSTKVATATNASSSSRTAASGPQQPGDGIVNGGFEGGIAPWQKFGGELGLVSSPVHGGSAAGSLVSTTTSTKWAYQVVAVDGAGVYLFDGYLLADPGVSEAYLRVSWYASDDGSGSALGNTDSTARIAGGGSDFTYLTTGAVEAPASARSARTRVMLAPAGSARAVLYMDDLSFGPSDLEPRSDAEDPATSEDAGLDAASGEGEALAGGPAEPASSAAAAPPAAAAASEAEARVATSEAPVALAQEVAGARSAAGRSPLLYVILGVVGTLASTAATVWAVRRFSAKPEGAAVRNRGPLI